MVVACITDVQLTAKSNLDITDSNSSASPLTPTSPYAFSFSSGYSTSSHIHMNHVGSSSNTGSVRSHASSSASSYAGYPPSPTTSRSFLLNSPASPYSYSFKGLRFPSASSPPVSSAESACPSSINSSTNNSRAQLNHCSVASTQLSDSFISFTTDSTYCHSPTADDTFSSANASFASRRYGVAGSCFIEEGLEGLSGSIADESYNIHGQPMLVSPPLRTSSKLSRKKGSTASATSHMPGSTSSPVQAPPSSGSILLGSAKYLKRVSSLNAFSSFQLAANQTDSSKTSRYLADSKLSPVRSSFQRPLSILHDVPASLETSSLAPSGPRLTLGALELELERKDHACSDWFVDYRP